MELDKAFLKNINKLNANLDEGTAIESKIAQKWHDRGEIKTELEIDDFFLNNVVPNAHDYLPKHRRWAAKDIVDKWSNRGETNFVSHFSWDPNEIIFDPLNHTIKELSIVDYLTYRTYISQKFLKEHNISIEKMRMMLEVDLYEIAKKNNILFSVLHVVALHAKNDPKYKLRLSHPETDQFGNELIGSYHPMTGEVTMTEPSLRTSNARGFLAHEWTHLAMYMLFNNSAKPYSYDDHKANTTFERIVQSIRNGMPHPMDNRDPDEDYNDPDYDAYQRAYRTFLDGFLLYDKHYWEQEVIARFTQIMASSDYDYPSVQEFTKPIYDYWMQYIQPAIKKYVQERAKIDTFISDQERELILDPFYRQMLNE